MAKKNEDPTPAEIPASAEIPEVEITAKIRAGLTREQAVEVITNQRKHEAAQG